MLATSQSIVVNVSDIFDLAVSSAGIKTLNFYWSASTGASFYKLLVNTDGNSGYTQEGLDINGTSVNVIIPVHLTDWVNASYILEAYDSSGLLESSSPINITDQMLQVIGELASSNPTADNTFRSTNIAVSDDGSTIVMGDSYEDSSTTGINSTPNFVSSSYNGGAVYVFVKDGLSWTRQAYIKASNTGGSDLFGQSVALSGDGSTLAVGASYEDSSTKGINTIPNDFAQDAGAAYIFTRSGTSWAQQAYIKASNTDSADYFGYALDLSGDGNTLVVGALNEDSVAVGINGSQENAGESYNTGAVYLFNRVGITWSQSAYIKAFNTGDGDEFGISVSISRDGALLAVGARGERSDSVGVNPIPNDDAVLGGAVYIYTFDGFIWKHAAFVKSPRSNSSSAFGNWLGLNIDGSTLVVGTDRDNVFLY